MKAKGNFLFPLTSTEKLCLPDCFAFIMRAVKKVTASMLFYSVFSKKKLGDLLNGSRPIFLY